MKKYFIFFSLLFIFLCPMSVDGASSHLGRVNGFTQDKPDEFKVFGTDTIDEQEEYYIEKAFSLPKNMIVDAIGTADGNFGAKTETALKKFQTDYKLVADGKYGANTRQKMQEVIIYIKLQNK